MVVVAAKGPEFGGSGRRLRSINGELIVRSRVCEEIVGWDGTAA